MLSRLLASESAETSEAAVELPFDAIWFGVIAMATFLFLLLVTFAFRSVHTRH